MTEAEEEICFLFCLGAGDRRPRDCWDLMKSEYCVFELESLGAQGRLMSEGIISDRDENGYIRRLLWMVPDYNESAYGYLHPVQGEIQTYSELLGVVSIRLDNGQTLPCNYKFGSLIPLPRIGERVKCRRNKTTTGIEAFWIDTGFPYINPTAETLTPWWDTPDPFGDE